MDFKNYPQEDIYENYSKVNYNSLVLVIDKNDNFFNATRLCTEFNKDFDAWYSLPTTRNLITYYVNKLDETNTLNYKSVIRYIYPYDPNDNVFNVTVRGIYLHNLLLPSLLFWVSPIFYNKWLNEKSFTF